MALENKEQFILLVEDDDSVREALVWALEYSGYKIVAVSNGQDALDLLETDPLPSIIFLDLMMPMIDGFAFQDIKKLNPRIRNIPTVIASAKVNLDEIHTEFCLSKPFELQDVLSLIKKINLSSIVGIAI